MKHLATWIATAAQLAGLACLVAAAAIAGGPAGGFAAAGTALVLIGVATERSTSATTRSHGLNGPIDAR